jgi:acylphosphatase
MVSSRRVAALVSGLVQGVFFRVATQQQARRLGLTGWVRNLPDGRVEAQFQGAPDAVEAMLAWCARGPRGARVDEVEASDVDPAENETGFLVR